MVLINNPEFFKRIYVDVFCNIFSKSYYIFLCGGAGKNNVRDKVRILLEEKNFKVLYPEDLFMDMLNKNKKSNLFEFENLLAQNSDIVCVICESMGSAVELGTFAQSEEVRKKMVAAIEYKYSRDKSFINMGPLKYLEKLNKDSVAYYKKDNLKHFTDTLVRQFMRMIRRDKKEVYNNSLDRLAAFIVYIPLVVYFFQSISREELHSGIKEMLVSSGVKLNKYNELFNATIKYLLKNRILLEEYSLELNKEVYKLSAEGIDDTIRMLKNNVKNGTTMLYDNIRCDIMKEQFNK